MRNNRQDYNILNNQTYGQADPRSAHIRPNPTSSQRSGIQRSQRSSKQERSHRSNRHYQKSTQGSVRSEIQKSQRTNNSRPERSYNQSIRSQKSSTRSSKKNSKASSKKDTKLSESKVTEFHRPTESQVSQAKDLICDGCLNHKQHAHKEREAQKQKEKDDDFARKVNESLKKQLEDERARKAMENMEYKDAAEQYRHEQNAYKEALAEFEREDMNNYARNVNAMNREIDDWEAQMNHDKRKLYNLELNDQMEEQEEMRMYRKEIELDIDRKNHNLILDDAWKEGKIKEAMAEYDAGLKEQLASNVEKRNKELKERQLTDNEYRQRYKEMVDEERQQMDYMRNLKRGVLNDAYEEQIYEREQKQRAEDERLKQEHINQVEKIEQENDFYEQFQQMKKEMKVEHGQGLRQQFGIKEREAADEKQRDIEYQDRVIENAQRELQEEAERNQMKRDIYKDALVNQLIDDEERKIYLKEKEQEGVKEYVEYNNERNRMLSEHEKNMQIQKRERLNAELNDQVLDNEEVRRRRAELEWETDQKNHNLVLDDYWKHPLQEEMNKQYQQEILGQMGEDDLKREREAAENLREALEIKRQAIMSYEEEQRYLKENADLKKNILTNDLITQQHEKQVLRQMEHERKLQDDEEHRQQVELMKQHYLDNMFMKQKQNEEHLNDIVKQLGDKEMERRLQEAKDKLPADTTLTVPQHKEKCGTCHNCHKKKPLRRLNKKVRVPKRKPK